MRAFVLVVACADAFSYTHHFEALPAPRGEPTTDERCMTVCYTDDARRVNRWLRDNAAGAAALGFDTETACAFPGRKPPAPGPHVLQLAAGDACLVAHLVSGDVCASGALAAVATSSTSGIASSEASSRGLGSVRRRARSPASSAPSATT